LSELPPFFVCHGSCLCFPTNQRPGIRAPKTIVRRSEFRKSAHAKSGDSVNWKKRGNDSSRREISKTGETEAVSPYTRFERA